MKVKTLNGNLNIIGKNLRKFRKQRKISQPEICRKLDLILVTYMKLNMVKKQLRTLKLWLFARF